MEQFIETILKNLQNNGFPQKRVSLPLEKLYEVAEEKGHNFNKVLEELEKQGIQHEKTLDKIIFSPSIDPNSEMFSKAQEMLGQMTPEQIQQLQETFANMSDEERMDLLKKAQDMGLT